MIFIVISSEFPPGPGGIGQHAASFVHALSEKGKVYVLSNQDYAEQKEVKYFNIENKDVFQISTFKKRGGKSVHFKRIRQAFKLVDSTNPDIVFVSGRFPLWIGSLLKMKYPKMKVVGFVHGTEVTRTGSINSKITGRAYRSLDKVIAVSNFTKSLLHPKLKNNKVQVIPNGLDKLFLKETSKLSIEPFDWVGSPKLLTVGNVTPRKGQHRVVKALPTILEKYPNAHYHIVGLPTDKGKIENLAKNLGVENSITIHGRLPNRDDLYRGFVTSDIFTMLSENQQNGDLEGFGIAILEANAFKIPVIGAKGCGIEDAVDNSSGILVDGDNEHQIVKAIEKILTSKEVYKKGARIWAEAHNWDNLIDEVLK